MKSDESNHNCFTIDVEDWFHILDSPAVPTIAHWESLESRVDRNVNKLLELLEKYGVKSTMFWLGWVAKKNWELVQKCHAAGHEIASHGYAHVLAYEVGRIAFGEDIRKGKALLENIVGDEVKGFRAAGFSTTDDTNWTFNMIAKAGYKYDSSVFPSSRGHGGMKNSLLEPHIIHTKQGDLVEIPQSMLEVLGKRISFFGGGYMRIAPQWLINWGIKSLHDTGRPLIIYVHPREVDPNHPRLPLGIKRTFKSYVNLKTTLPKLEMLCKKYKFIKMMELAEKVTINIER